MHESRGAPGFDGHTNVFIPPGAGDFERSPTCSALAFRSIGLYTALRSKYGRSVVQSLSGKQSSFAGVSLFEASWAHRAAVALPSRV